MSKDVVLCAMMMKIKNTRDVASVQEIQLVHYSGDKGTIKMKYRRRKKCKCEQYNHKCMKSRPYEKHWVGRNKYIYIYIYTITCNV